MKTPALVLDRDGVINIDHAYVHRKEDFHFLGGIFELVATANSLGYLVVVVTNQAGIGRGHYSEDAICANQLRACCCKPRRIGILTLPSRLWWETNLRTWKLPEQRGFRYAYVLARMIMPDVVRP